MKLKVNNFKEGERVKVWGWGDPQSSERWKAKLFDGKTFEIFSNYGDGYLCVGHPDGPYKNVHITQCRKIKPRLKSGAV